MSELTVEFPIGLKLEAKDPTEQKVLEYLKSEGSQELITKINNAKKTLKGALAYAKDEAKKMMEKGDTSGYVMVDDETVFGWIIHYFEEDSIEEKQKPAIKMPGKVKVNTKPQTTAPKASTEPIVEDLFGAKEVKRQRVRPF